MVDVEIHFGGGPIKNDLELVNLHPFQGTQWVLFFHECCFDSYGCLPPQKLSKFFLKRNGYCLYCEYNIQSLTKNKTLIVQVMFYVLFT